MMKLNYRPVLEKYVDETIAQIGVTTWYSNLHRSRFIDILCELSKIKAIRGEKVLELGIWPGYLALSLQRSGWDVTGVDKQPERLSIIAKQLEIRKVNLNELHQSSLPYQTDSFDVVVASEIIEHLVPSALPNLFMEIKRILKPGGMLLITTPNKQALGNYFHRSKSTAVDSLGHGHCQEYTKIELTEKIAASGFNVCIVRTVNFYDNVGKLKNNEYFYPLSDLFHYANKLHNCLKFIIRPMRLIPVYRDSILLIAKKDD